MFYKPILIILMLQQHLSTTNPHVHLFLSNFLLSDYKSLYLSKWCWASYRVAYVCPTESLMCTMSKDPGCLSRCWITPTRPKLCPPVTIHKFPANNNACFIHILIVNFKLDTILFILKSNEFNHILGFEIRSVILFSPLFFY